MIKKIYCTIKPKACKTFISIAAAFIAAVFLSGSLSLMTPGPAAAKDFGIQRQEAFKDLNQRWKNDSAEMELKFKNLSPDDILTAEKQLYYLFTHRDEFNFLFALILKSDHPDAVELSGRILNDEKIGYSARRSILHEISGYMASDKSKNKARVRRILQNFAVSDTAKKSNYYIIAALNAIAACQDEESEKIFTGFFDSQQNTAVKAELFRAAAGFKNGVDMLSAEYKKAIDKNDIKTAIAALRAMSGIKSEAAYDRLSDLLKKESAKNGGGANGKGLTAADNPLYNHIRDCAAACGNKKFTPVIEALLASKNAAEIDKGFEYLLWQSDNQINAACKIYWQLNEAQHKKFYLRKLADFLKSRTLNFKKASAEEIKSAYSIVKEAMAQSEPALKKAAFEIISENLKNEEFKTLVKNNGEKDFLTLLAFYINGEREGILNYIKTADFTETVIKYKEITGNYPSRFKFDAADYRGPEELNAFFNFLKLQTPYFQKRVIEDIAAAGDKDLVKKLAEFSRNCPPDFIKTLKSVITANADRLGVVNDEYLLNYSDFSSSTQYKNMTANKKYFESAGGSLKKYLVTLISAGNYETEYAFSAIADFIKKTPEVFMETLKDEYYPLEAKLLLIRAAVEKINEIKNEINAGGLNELITTAGADARLDAAAVNLLAQIDTAQALDALKKALAAAAGDPYREPLLLKAASFIKTPECAEFVIDKFVSPAVDIIDSKGGAAENSETIHGGETFAGESIFKAAMEVLHESGDRSKAAIEKLINQKPFAAPILIQFSAAGEAGGAAVKYYLNSFDSSRYANRELNYLRRFADKSSIEPLIEFYNKKAGDINARLTAAAILYKNGIPFPAAAVMEDIEKSGSGFKMIAKLLDAGFDPDFIIDHYGAAEKIISNPPDGRDKISRAFKNAESEFHERYPGYGKEYILPAPPEFIDPRAVNETIISAACDNQKSVEVYLKYLDGAKAFHGFESAFLLKALNGKNLSEPNLIAISRAALKHGFINLTGAAHKRITAAIEEKLANEKNANEKPSAAEYNILLDALIDSCDIGDYKKCLAIIENLVSTNKISAETYSDAAYRLCSPINLKSAGFQNLSLRRKSSLIRHILSMNSFDINLTFGENALELTMDFNAILSSKNADTKFIDSLIQENEGSENDFDYNYGPALYLLRLIKTNGAQAKLDFITASIDKIGTGNRYYRLDTIGRYFEMYDGDNLINLFAGYYADNIDKIKNEDKLMRLIANVLNGDTLKKIISDHENKKDEYGLSQHIFDAYASRGGTDRFTHISSFCESKKYGIKSRALDSLKNSGDEGFETLKALFEKHCKDKNNYNANDYISAMADTGSARAFKFLSAAALDNGLKKFHPRIIDETGKIKTAESLNWLLSQLFIHEQSPGIFNALNNMCRQMIFEFLEAYKNASGKRKTAAASILFQHSIKKPFIEIMAADPQLIAELDKNFRPSPHYLERGDNGGILPEKLMEKALSAINAVVKVNLNADYKPERETAEFHSYLCQFLGLSRNIDDIKLLIGLLNTGACASSAARALNYSRLDISEELIAAARNKNNSAKFQKDLITLLINKDVSDASYIYLNALDSKDAQLLSSAIEAVSKFKIKEAVPAVIGMLDSKENKNEYHLINCLLSFSTEAFTPLLDAAASSGNTEGIYRALKGIVDAAAYKSNGEAKRELSKQLDEKFELYSKNNLGTALLISFLLAGLDEFDKLSMLLEKDADILLLAGEGLFDFIASDKLVKLGDKVSLPLVNLLIKSDGEKNGFKYSIIETLEKIGDASIAPALSNYLKTCRDDYLKRRILEALSKILKDGLAVYLDILAGEKDYYLRRRATENLAQIASSDQYCRGEILKLISGRLEDEIKAVLIKALAGVKYAQAAPVMLAAVKKSRTPVLLEAASDGLFKLDILEDIRLNLTGIIKEPETELNSAYAARVLSFYRDSQSVDIIGAALKKAIEKGGAQAKIEFIKAAASINSRSFLDALSLATSDPAGEIRTAAVTAVKIIAGSAYDKYCAPPPPRNLKAEGGDGAVFLIWDAPDGRAVESYQIYRDNKKIAAIPAAACQYSDSGLKNGKRFSYFIKATDAHSNISAPCSAVTAAASAPPGPVNNFKLKGGPSYITLSWQYEPPGDNAVEVDHFIIERNSKPAAKLPANSITYTDYGLSAGKIYAYKIYAVNRMGGSGAKAGASGAPHFIVEGGE